MKRFIICALLLAFLLLAGCGQSTVTPGTSGNPTHGSIPSGQNSTGWYTVDGDTYYRLPNGSNMTGMVQIGENTYLFDADGRMQTGWAEQNGTTYYFLEDGAMAKGQVEIDGQSHFFTATGKEVLVVNPWNPVPEGYDPDLVSVSTDYSKEGTKVSRACYDALVQMVTDCNRECPTVYITSSHRTYEYQAGLFENRIQRFQNEGYSREEAEKLAASVVAKPGTSEHHLGLAVDIIDTRDWSLTEVQAELPGQQWLMENCWRYGFILRYPKGTTDSTGIIYEPWHYRYVGVELAKELYESNLTLEEYFTQLTQ